MFASEDGVFALLPFDMKRPLDVLKDGQGGVTQATWDSLLEDVETEMQVRLDAEGVPAPERSHQLIVGAANRFLAAQVCRKNKVYQEQANSFFADANIKLKLFFQKVMRREEEMTAPEVVVNVLTAEQTRVQDYGLSQSYLSVFSNIKIG